ncbi:MAG: YHYH domain-containing protein [Gemmatimonadetes bacterium]|nr:YHYH domain-containing protein [Gemmatimonadota bacterium]
MRRRRWLRAVLVSCLVLSVAATALAHGGGLDGYGGHNDRKRGGYHFHRGPLTGQAFPSKEAALAALAKAGTQSPPPAPAPAPVAAAAPVATSPVPPPVFTAEQRLQALEDILIAKGVIAREELNAMLQALVVAP